VGNPKGSRFEREVLDYLRESGYDAERLRLTGKEDEGDLLIRLDHPPVLPKPRPKRVVLEAKNVKRMSLAGWVQEAEVEALNYADHRGLDYDDVHWAVVHKKHGKGVAKSYVTLPLDEFLRLL